MATLLALRHVPFEDLGVLDFWFQAHGFEVRYVEVGQPGWETAAAGEADLMVVLGGPIGVYETEAYPFLVPETALIRARLTARKPILGICLGAQLMAQALGARVAFSGVKEIGFAPLALTAAGQDSVLEQLNGAAVLHWHGDAFEMPVGAAALASTPLCATQAFALDGHALALQFHLEVDLERLEAWLIGHAVELAAAGIDPRTLRREAARHAPALYAAAIRVIGAWVEGWRTPLS